MLTGALTAFVILLVAITFPAVLIWGSRSFARRHGAPRIQTWLARTVIALALLTFLTMLWVPISNYTDPPFPLDDPSERATLIGKTISEMMNAWAAGFVLMLFVTGVSTGIAIAVACKRTDHSPRS
jgi:hypothetical protein